MAVFYGPVHPDEAPWWKQFYIKLIAVFVVLCCLKAKHTNDSVSVCRPPPRARIFKNKIQIIGAHIVFVHKPLRIGILNQKIRLNFIADLQK